MKIKKYLSDNKLLADKIENCKNGDFIELEVEIEGNPLLQIMRAMHNANNAAALYGQLETKGGHKTKKKSNNDPIQNIIDDLESSSLIDCVGKIVGTEATVIISFERKYLLNRDMSGLIGETFKVLGKVTSHEIDSSSSQSFNILKRTNLGILKSGLDQVITEINSIRESGSIDIPEFKRDIEPPYVSILPIAIYT